jgi:hypothetical protein
MPGSRSRIQSAIRRVRQPNPWPRPTRVPLSARRKRDVSELVANLLLMPLSLAELDLDPFEPLLVFFVYAAKLAWSSWRDDGQDAGGISITSTWLD